MRSHISRDEFRIDKFTRTPWHLAGAEERPDYGVPRFEDLYDTHAREAVYLSSGNTAATCFGQLAASAVGHSVMSHTYLQTIYAQ